MPQSLDYSPLLRPQDPVLSQASSDVWRCLKVYLTGQETLLLPLVDIAGIVAISLDQVLPVPTPQSAVVGAVEWRGTILWVLDLSFYLQGSPLSQQSGSSTYSLVILTVKEHQLGVLVSDVGDIQTLDRQQLQPPSVHLLKSVWLPAVKGIVSQSGIPLLDTPSLFEAVCHTKSFS